MDARALLRAQREQRRINHPLAAYSSTGQLFCTACRLPLKSDSLWDLHVKSSQHHAAVSKQELAQQHDWDAVAAKRGNDAGLKRKARDRDDDDEEDDIEERRAGKKARPATATEQPTQRVDKDSSADNTSNTAKSQLYSTEPELKAEVQLPSHHRPLSSRESVELPTNQQNGTHSNGDTVDEDEWAAFEKELAAEEASTRTTNAVIEAPAMSAQEVAAQAIKEQSEQKDSREAELEDAREDAQRQLEDEFEKMENYEDRIQKLRQRREGVKHQPSTGADHIIVDQPLIAQEKGDDDDDDDDDDDNDNDSDNSEDFLWNR